MRKKINNTIILELWKATHSTSFYVSLLIGCIIALINIFENYNVVRVITDHLEWVVKENIPLSRSYEGCSLFVSWLALRRTGLGSVLLLYLWPTIVALPYSWSYSSDRLHQMNYQIATRSSRKIYFFAKYISIFISGGIACVVPFAVDLFLNSLICPYCVPNVNNSLVGIFNGHFLSMLFYTSPWAYAFVWLWVCFLLGGGTACMCFLSKKRKHQALVVLNPFFVFLTFEAFVSWFSNMVHLPYEISPIQMVFSSTATPNPAWVVFSIILILMISTFFAGYTRMQGYELD